MDMFPDIGYSPDNLRHLIQMTGLTQKEFCEKYFIKLRTLQSYLSDIYTKNHRDMSYEQWKELVFIVLNC